MEVIVQKVGAILCLQIQGRFDTSMPKGFESVLLHLIEQGETHLVFDFSHVEHVSSSGLRVLLRAFKQVTYANGRMAFHSLNERVHRIFDVAGLTLIFRIYESREAALGGVMFTRMLPINILDSLGPQPVAVTGGTR